MDVVAGINTLILLIHHHQNGRVAILLGGRLKERERPGAVRLGGRHEGGEAPELQKEEEGRGK